MTSRTTPGRARSIGRRALSRAGRGIALCAVGLSLAACGGTDAPPLPPPDTTAFRSDTRSLPRDTANALPLGEAISLDLPDLNGDTLRLSSLRGRVVLVNFWATWCGPCREEIPDFLALRRDLGPRGLEIVGVSMDLEAAPVGPFVREMAIPYPIVLGGDDLPDRVAGLLVLPTTLVLDRDGRLVRRLPGRFQTAQLRPLLESLLGS